MWGWNQLDFEEILQCIFIRTPRFAILTFWVDGGRIEWTSHLGKPSPPIRTSWAAAGLRSDSTWFHGMCSCVLLPMTHESWCCVGVAGLPLPLAVGLGPVVGMAVAYSGRRCRLLLPATWSLLTLSRVDQKRWLLI